MPFQEQCKRLALQGYSAVWELPRSERCAIARSWLLETVDLDDRTDPRTRMVPLCFTHSVCTTVSMMPEFIRAASQLLHLYSLEETLDLVRTLSHQGNANVVPMHCVAH